MLSLRSFFILCISGGMFIAAECFATHEPAAGLPVEPQKQPVSGPETDFAQHVAPFLERYCQSCHNVDSAKGNVRLDNLTARPNDRQLFQLEQVLSQIDTKQMPPTDEEQPTDGERQKVMEWITSTLKEAREATPIRNGSIRRLTVGQYRHTLQELLAIPDDLTRTLPPDAVSKDGFTNNEQSMTLSPQQTETYFEIAGQALDLAMVNESEPPVIQKFRMDFGRRINPTPCPDNLILGANSELLRNEDFVVTELAAAHSFPFQPFHMQRKFEFIEGYVGNDTIRQWKKFDSIYHAVFACMRGSPGYPKGDAWEMNSDGMLLRPAIPSSEIFGVSNTYGPQANFKISLRELPDRGRFRVTVRAAKSRDAMLLDAKTPVRIQPESLTLAAIEAGSSAAGTVSVPQTGIYQVDAVFRTSEEKGAIRISAGDRAFRLGINLADGTRLAAEDAASDRVIPLCLISLEGGELPLEAAIEGKPALQRLVVTRLPDDSPQAAACRAFDQRTPFLGVHVGLRRDCGSTLTQVQQPVAVSDHVLRDYIFEGAINDFPSPDVEKDNVNYLAGIREIGVRHEYTDGRDIPRMLIRSVEFEGPILDAWPLESHRRIFATSPHQLSQSEIQLLEQKKASSEELEAFATDIITAFAGRAFRRPVKDNERSRLFNVWRESWDASHQFRASIRDVLQVVLTSPQFLFLIEESASPEAEPLNGHELASRLSYIFWNAPPDERLRELAASGKLQSHLNEEFDRLLNDDRADRFLQQFASEWFALDRFDVVATDSDRFPKLTRDTKTQLRREPVEYLAHMMRENLSIRNLVTSDFIVANDVVAQYYGVSSECGLDFRPIAVTDSHLGGIMTQASVLAGLSNGREPNPIKRGAWIARRIVAEPPDDPPPNVPQLPENDGSTLTLRQKLEQHRNQEGCAKCHSGIDPWGLPFEEYDAAGMFHERPAESVASTLPDGTNVSGVRELKRYLAEDRLDQVAFSFLKHFVVYVNGRPLSYSDHYRLKAMCRDLRGSNYAIRDLMRTVLNSDLCLTK